LELLQGLLQGRLVVEQRALRVGDSLLQSLDLGVLGERVDYAFRQLAPDDVTMKLDRPFQEASQDRPIRPLTPPSLSEQVSTQRLELVEHFLVTAGLEHGVGQRQLLYWIVGRPFPA